MKRILIGLFWLTALGTFSVQAKLNVVATLPDYGALAEEIGGEHVKVTTLCRGTEDAHFVDAKPSFIRVLNQADVLIEGGAELEVGWLPTLVNSARNPRILGDAPGHVILSRTLQLLEIPKGPVDRSQGDVHPAGNPHYNLDPANGRPMAMALAEAFGKVDAAHAAFYQEKAKQFAERLDRKVAEWTKLLEPYRGAKVITYHKSYDYLLQRFGFELVGTIEPKPGIEPSPSYVNGLITRLKASGVKLVLIEPYRPKKTPDVIAQAIGAKVIMLPDKVGAHAEAKDYLSLFDYDVGLMVSALKP